MYQTLVLGLGLLLITGLAYYIKHTDTNGVVTGSFSATTTTITPSTSESIPGTYLCDQTSGCENPRSLHVFANGEVKLSSSFDNGVELIEEFGTWTTDQGTMQVVLTGTNAETYPTPRMIIIKTILEGKLSNLIFDSKFFTDWKNPHFLRNKEL